YLPSGLGSTLLSSREYARGSGPSWGYGWVGKLSPLAATASLLARGSHVPAEGDPAEIPLCSGSAEVGDGTWMAAVALTIPVPERAGAGGTARRSAKLASRSINMPLLRDGCQMRVREAAACGHPPHSTSRGAPLEVTGSMDISRLHLRPNDAHEVFTGPATRSLDRLDPAACPWSETPPWERGRPGTRTPDSEDLDVLAQRQDVPASGRRGCRRVGRGQIRSTTAPQRRLEPTDHHLQRLDLETDTRPASTRRTFPQEALRRGSSWRGVDMAANGSGLRKISGREGGEKKTAPAARRGCYAATACLSFSLRPARKPKVMTGAVRGILRCTGRRRAGFCWPAGASPVRQLRYLIHPRFKNWALASWACFEAWKSLIAEFARRKVGLAAGLTSAEWASMLPCPPWAPKQRGTRSSGLRCRSHAGTEDARHSHRAQQLAVRDHFLPVEISPERTGQDATPPRRAAAHERPLRSGSSVRLGHPESRPTRTIITSCTVPGTVAVTFDDGPSIYTAQLLDTLATYGVKATFFIVGAWQNRPIDDPSQPWIPLLRRMHNEGHQLALHTWTHPDLSTLPREDIHTEMVKTETAFMNIFGFCPTYFRPPYLSCNALCMEVAASFGYHILSIDVDTKDYENQQTMSVSEGKFDAGLDAGGNMVLAHDIHEQTVLTLTPYMLDGVLARGLRPVTAGECLGDDPSAWYRATRDLRRRRDREDGDIRNVPRVSAGERLRPPTEPPTLAGGVRVPGIGARDEAQGAMKGGEEEEKRRRRGGEEEEKRRRGEEEKRRRRGEKEEKRRRREEEKNDESPLIRDIPLNLPTPLTSPPSRDPVLSRDIKPYKAKPRPSPSLK
ncbi:hypothetical protein JHW43_006135, partial [Diplocarpon mali]